MITNPFFRRYIHFKSQIDQYNHRNSDTTLLYSKNQAMSVLLKNGSVSIWTF